MSSCLSCNVDEDGSYEKGFSPGTHLKHEHAKYYSLYIDATNLEIRIALRYMLACLSLCFDNPELWFHVLLH